MLLEKTCEHCGKLYKTDSRRQRFCGYVCSAKSREAKKPKASYLLLCGWCKEQFTSREKNRKYCCKSCVAKHARSLRPNRPWSEETKKKISEGLKRAFAAQPELARISSERMKTKNPMRLASVRQKVSKIFKEKGVQPKVKGGNGRPLPVPQQMLLDALGWVPEFPISLGERRPGYPTCYKADLGNPELKIAIEVDGPSHHSPRARATDQKKDSKLALLGWVVLRFSNTDVLSNLSGVLETINQEVKARLSMIFK